jgi:hypothetical protein
MRRKARFSDIFHDGEEIIAFDVGDYHVKVILRDLDEAVNYRYMTLFVKVTLTSSCVRSANPFGF